MSQTKTPRRRSSLRAVARTLPLLLPAVSALAPLDAAIAASSKTADLQMLAQAAARGDDMVSAEHLRNLLVAKQGNFTLIDIRSPSAFAQGHIDGATNIPLPRLFDEQTIVRLRRSPQVIVYGDRTAKEAQAATLLRVAGVPARALDGGLLGWSNKLQAWSADAETFQIVRALNDCPSTIPHGIPPLNSAGVQPTTAAAPSSPVADSVAAPSAKASGRIRLKGTC